MKDRIKAIRKEVNLTQENFSKRIGVKRNTLANYETGRNIPLDAIIFSMCNEFGINEQWLRTGEGEMHIELSDENKLMKWSASVLKDESDSFKRRFINMLMQLDEKEWKALEKYAYMLIDNRGKE